VEYDRARATPLRPVYYLRSRPAARQPQLIATSMAHLGFRCVVRPNGQEL
jgi:formylglycine-generating enzyme required for sulfatase activity